MIVPVSALWIRKNENSYSASNANDWVLRRAAGFDQKGGYVVETRSRNAIGRCRIKRQGREAGAFGDNEVPNGSSTRLQPMRKICPMLRSETTHLYSQFDCTK